MFSFRTKAPFKMKSSKKIYKEACLIESRLTKLLLVKIIYITKLGEKTLKVNEL